MKTIKVIVSTIIASMSMMLFGGAVVGSDTATALHYKAIEEYTKAQTDSTALDRAISTWEDAWKARGCDVQLAYKIAWNLFAAYVVRWEAKDRSADLSAAIRYYVRSRMARESFSSEDVVIASNDKSIAVVFNRILPLAESGNVDAMEAIGYMYYKGEGTTLSYEDAIKWIKKAAVAGSGFSMSVLGNMYENGQGVEKSMSEALAWWKRASDKGYPSALTNLGLHYWKEKKYEEARKWLLMAAAYEEPNAMAVLGYMFWKGHGVEQSYDEAKRWMEKGMSGGCIYAPLYMGCLYYDKKWSLHSDEQARTLFASAANAGNAEGMWRLSICALNGIGGEKDFGLATKWLKVAAEKGYVMAQYELGKSYRLGRGVEKDSGNALKWFEKAGDRGHVESQAMVGFMYKTGEGCEKDISKAIEWYTKAADGGNKIAQYTLGTIYYFGQSGAKDYTRAFGYFEKAAKQNYADSQWFYGCMMWYGDGCQKNEDGAKEWINKAARGGNKEALKFLKEFKDYQTSEEERSKIDAKVKGMHLEALDLQCRWDAEPKTLNKSIELWESALKMLKMTSPDDMTEDEIAISYKIAYNLFNAYAVRWGVLKVKDDVAASISSYMLTRLIKSRIPDGADKLIPEAESHKRIAILLPDIKLLANDGNAGAMSMLGMLYLYGKCVPKSAVDAERWLSKAAKKGDEIAQTFLKKLKNGEVDDL